MFLMSSAFAENAFNLQVGYDKKENLISVNGSTEQEKEKVLLYVIKPGHNIEGLHDDNISERLYTIVQTETDANGKFSFSVKWNETLPGGEYTFAVSADKTAAEPANRQLNYYLIGNDTKQAAIEAVNSAADAESMAAAISKCDLELDLSGYGDITKLASKLLKLKGGNTLSYDEIVSACRKSVFYCNIDDSDVSKEMLENYFNEEDIPENYSMRKDEAAKLMNIVEKEEILSDEQVLALMNVCGIIADINASGREELIEKLEKHKDVIGIGTVDEYKKYCSMPKDDKIKFNIALVNKEYTSLSQIKEAFVKRSAEYKPEDSNSGSNGGGSSGGSSGGGSKKTPSVSVPIINTGEIKKAEDEYKITFDDLTDYEWAREAVEALAKKKYIDGTSKGVFSPEQNISREQLVKMLVNIFEIESSDKDCAFSDCGKSEWYYPYICAAVEKGIVTGITEDTFGVEMPVTREDLCTMAMRVIKLKEITLNYGAGVDFADAEEISDYAAEAVRELSDGGIINGSDGIFNPKSSATRAEAAVILYRIIQMEEK